MARAAVTFDFHNTIARCDEWFDIEVNGLVSAFLRWQSVDRGVPIDEQTLWSADQAYKALRTAIRDHGNELTSEECVATVLDELSLSYDDREIARGIDQLLRPTLEFTQPMPGAIETIARLGDAGVPLGVVSSAVHHPFLEWTLERFGVNDAFSTVTTSASAGYYKSRPEIFLSALTALDALPEYSVHVGDSPRYDVGGAQRAGMRTVLVSGRDRQDGSNVVPDLTLPDLLDSAPLILDLLNQRSGESVPLSSGPLQ
jgi:HAD superfamily hydrolase (TIGR01509 family)